MRMETYNNKTYTTNITSARWVHHSTLHNTNATPLCEGAYRHTTKSIIACRARAPHHTGLYSLTSTSSAEPNLSLSTSSSHLNTPRVEHTKWNVQASTCLRRPTVSIVYAVRPFARIVLYIEIREGMRSSPFQQPPSFAIHIRATQQNTIARFL